MIVTEEEAKTKRCQESFGDGFVSSGATGAIVIPAKAPFSCSFSVGDVAGAIAISSPIHCIGSACMAWRWDQETIETKPLADFIDPKPRVMADWTIEKLDAAYQKAVLGGWPGTLGADWYHGYPLKVSRSLKRNGFCGKASKP